MKDSRDFAIVDGILITYVSVTVRAMPYISSDSLLITYNEEKKIFELAYSGLSVQGQGGTRHKITAPVQKTISISEQRNFIKHLKSKTKLFDLLKESKLDLQEQNSSSSPDYGLEIHWKKATGKEFMYVFSGKDAPDTIMEIMRKISLLALNHDMIDASGRHYD